MANKLIRGILGVLLVLGLVGYLTSCIPDIEEAIDEAAEQCEDIATREREKAETECASLLNKAIGDFQTWVEWRLEKAKADTLKDIGCIPDDSEFGWDCEAVCERL